MHRADHVPVWVNNGRDLAQLGIASYPMRIPGHELGAGEGTAHDGDQAANDARLSWQDRNAR